MISDLCEGQLCLKTTENDQSFRIKAKVVKLSGEVFHFMYLTEKNFIFGWACQILGRNRWNI